MDLETKGKRFPPKIRAADSAPRINCRRTAPERFQSSPICGGLSLRAWSTAQCRGNLFAGTVAPFHKEKSHRRTQDRHEAAPYAQKVPQHPDARPVILARVRAREKMTACGQCFNPLGKIRALKGNILNRVASRAT